MSTSTKVIHQKFYVELDCLLDTRIGVIHSLNSQAALEVLEKGFHKRTKDNISELTTKITQEQFKQAYKKRDANILPDCRPTQYYFLLRNIIEGIKNQQATRFDVGDIEIFINVYPYQLTETEIVEIENGLSSFYRADVKCLNLPNYAITLEKIKAEDWVLVAIYDGSSWVERITNAMAEDKKFNPETVVKMPRVTMNFPALLLDSVNDPKKEDLTTEDGQVLDVFETIRLMFVEIVAIDFLSPAMFSLADPKTPVGNEEDESEQERFDEL